MNENIDNLSKFDYIIKRYTIRITHKALKNLDKMPKPEQEKFFRLKTALETRGPEQPSFMNYSKLGMNTCIIAICQENGLHVGKMNREL